MFNTDAVHSSDGADLQRGTCKLLLRTLRSEFWLVSAPLVKNGTPSRYLRSGSPKSLLHEPHPISGAHLT
jgi:hypothetical protein